MKKSKKKNVPTPSLDNMYNLAEALKKIGIDAVVRQDPFTIVDKEYGYYIVLKDYYDSDHEYVEFRFTPKGELIWT